MEEGYKPCPHCAEPIREGATICRFCNRSVASPASAPPLGVVTAPDTSKPATARAVPRGWLLAGLIFILLLIFLHRSALVIPVRRFLARASKSGQPTTAQTDSGVSQPQPPSPPPLVPVTKFSPIVNGNVVVPPRGIQYFNFIVPQVAQDAKVTGAFHAFGGAGNDIEAAIMTPFEFENWSNGHEARVYYNSGKVTNGEIEVDGIPPGLYILAFSNRSALVSRKEVTAQVSLSYTILERQ